MELAVKDMYGDNLVLMYQVTFHMFPEAFGKAVDAAISWAHDEKKVSEVVQATIIRRTLP